MKKRMLALLLAAVMTVGLLPVGVFAESGATEIRDQAGLADMKNGGSFVLAADIVLDGSWTPVNTYNDIVLDGNGHTVTLSGAPLIDSLSSGSLVTNLILDGAVQGGDYYKLGTLANANNGTVRNCISRVRVTYTGAGPMALVGGIIGDMQSGEIRNCYSEAVFGGAYDVSGAVANIGAFNSGRVFRCYAYERIGMKMETNWDTFEDVPVELDPAGIESVILAAGADLGAAAGTLNTYLESGDCRWAVSGGTLTLVPKAEAEKLPASEEELTALTAAIAAEEELPAALYTAASWAERAAALENAQNILAQPVPEQAAVVSAAERLHAAVQAMAVRAAEPLDAAGYQEISSAAELSMLADGGHYRLTADIDLSGESFWFGTYETMNCVLDGGGHTVTLPGAPLWGAIGENGVVQNLGIAGAASDMGHAGALAKTCSGMILNCWSRADVTADGQKNAGGLVASLLSGGAIVNCVSVGTVRCGGVSGAMAAVTEENTLLRDGLYMAGSAAGAAAGRVEHCESRSRADFYGAALIAQLNAGKGAFGLQWGVSADGWPYHGENQDYTPGGDAELVFTAWDGSQTVTFRAEDGLTLSLFDICQEPGEGYRMAGTLSCQQSPDATWSYDYQGSGGKNPVWVGEDGKIVLYYEGTATVRVSGSGLPAELSFPVRVVTGEISELRVLCGDEIVSGQTPLQVAGSADTALTVQGLTDGQWKTLPASLFTFAETDGLYVEGSIFHATRPGSFTLTVSGLGKTAEVQIESSYVPVTGLIVHPSGTYELHERSSMSGLFLDLSLSHGAGTVTVLPENASYKDWTLESSDPEIAAYVPDFSKAVQPYLDGTVTLTATSLDPMLEAPVTGSSTITLRYKNPLLSVSSDAAEFTAAAGETLALPLTFTGELSDYHVSETDMVWTYDKDGIVSVVREKPVELVGGEGETEYCVASDRFLLKALKAGTVTVTGTPVDDSCGAPAVTFTVTVTDDEGGEPPIDKSAVIETVLTTISEQFRGTGEDWNVVDMAAYDKAIPMDLDALRETAERVWNAKRFVSTDAERIVMALTAAGVDASRFPLSDGTTADFIAKIANAKDLGTVNGYIWALNAYDSGNFSLPADAVWTRDALVEYLLAHQCADGGWNLSGNVTADADIDMTAMAIAALSLYRDRSGVSAALDRALGYLSAHQDSDGTFSALGAKNANSAAMVIVALAAMDIDADRDARFVKDGSSAIDGLLHFKTADNTFGYKDADKSVAMSTEQGFRALVAYTNWQRVRAPYNIYVFSDAQIPAESDLYGVYQAAAEYLETMQPIAGSTVGGEWLVLSLARSDFAPDNEAFSQYLADAVAYIGSHLDSNGRLDRNASTDNSRMIVALTAIGQNAADIGGYDLLSGLTDMKYLKKQGLNGPIWALIAFDSLDYEIPGSTLTRDDLIAVILDAELPAGGWNRSSFAKTADPDITAMALYALAPYTDRAEVRQAADRGLNCLSAMQLPSGGFAVAEDNLESCAQVVVALSALGIDADSDARFQKNGSSVVDALLRFRLDDGGFCHYLGGGYDQMSTEQALYALAAYFRNQDGKNRLFDMTDTLPDTPEEPEIPETPADKTALQAAVAQAEALTEEAYTVKSWKVLADALSEAKAVLADENAPQSRVDAAATKLLGAIGALQKAGADKTALQAAVTQAERRKESSYTVKSWKPFESALKHAKRVLSDTDASQNEVDAALEKLTKAEAALKKPSANNPPANKPTEPTDPTEPTEPAEKATEPAEDVTEPTENTEAAAPETEPSAPAQTEPAQTAAPTEPAAAEREESGRDPAYILLWVLAAAAVLCLGAAADVLVRRYRSGKNK